MHEFTHELLQLKAQSSRRKEQASHPQGSSNSEEITIFAKGDETMLVSFFDGDVLKTSTEISHVF